MKIVKMLIDIRRPLIVCLLLVHLSRGLPTPSGEDDTSRRTEEIIRYAKSAEMRNYLNESFNPCTNFYNFACGNYNRINPPNTPPFQTNVFQSISKSLSRKISTLLNVQTANDSAIDKKVKNFYESCLNLPALRDTYKLKLKEIISEFGQMPALEGDKWQESEFDWLKTVAEIAHKYDIRIIVGFMNQVDSANNTVNRMHILLQDIPLESTSIYTDDVHKLFRRAHKRVMAKRLKNFLGLNAKLAEQTAKEIFEFECNLFVGYESDYLDEDDNTDDGDEDEDEQDTDEATEDSPEADYTFNLTTIEEMQTKYFPRLDIKRLIEISLGSVTTDPVYDLIEDEVENIDIVMRETPKRIVANYIFYHLIVLFMQKAPKDKDELQDECISTTKSHFAKILDNMVYRKYTTKKTENDVQYMFRTIKSAFHNVLQSGKLSWMTEDTRKYAVEKLKTIRMEINSYEQTNFTEEFGPLTINNHDYIENLKSIYSLDALRSRQKLHEPPKPYDDPESLSFTPVYILTENLIKVPVSILQPYYLWSDSYPNAFKFGTLGFLLSHELIHGFDEDGRTYDKLGNNKEWWDQSSNDYFKNNTECFKAQYRKYVYGGRLLPEQDSQSENIADNGGIRLAYDAYLQWYEDAMRTSQKMDFETMPRLNYSSKQLFFISYGQLWCSATHPVLRNVVASTDEHVPDKFRVIGPLSNFGEFSKEFNCRKGAGMNPTKKCIIY